jgi:hypothetical protein
MPATDGADNNRLEGELYAWDSNSNNVVLWYPGLRGLDRFIICSNYRTRICDERIG